MLFPQLAGKPFGYVNLNDLANRVRTRGNPFVDANRAQEHIQAFHKRVGWEWSYGGYLERRECLWENVPYLERANTFLHLGVDFNVPEGTDVWTTAPCKVVRIDCDCPEPFGWGTRIIVRLAEVPIFLIYAHLADRLRWKEGDVLGAGVRLACVGGVAQNGGWFPHLHVQAIDSEWWNYLSTHPGAMEEMDGYGRAGDIDILVPKYPDPLRYLKLWY